MTLKRDAKFEETLTCGLKNDMRGLVNFHQCSVPALNFNTESGKKLTLYDLLFLIAIYYPNNDSKRPSKMRNQHHNSHFTVTKVFLGWGLILTTGKKY